MKTIFILLPLLVLPGLLTRAKAQTAAPNPEKMWKDLSRLPQNLRDDLKKTTWWEIAATAKSTTAKLDSMVKYSSFNSGKSYPLNLSKFEYRSPGKIIQSDFVNYGEWVLQKRSTIARDAQNRVVDVLEEEPDPATGAFQPANKLHLYWHGKSDTQCDSIFASVWDDQSGQWAPAYRLYSFFDETGREKATETYRYADGIRYIGIREEYQLDSSGQTTIIQQFMSKEDKWIELGKVESTFDEQHHETTRQESILLAGGKVAPVRKLRRKFDANGNLTLEDRSKWSDATRNWAPLKSLTKGSDEKKGNEWVITESYKPNASFQNKVEIFRQENSAVPEREVHSLFVSKSKTWQVVAETRYYYSK